MKKTFILAIVLLLVIPAIQAQTGCCANPDNSNYCGVLTEETACCAGLTTEQCDLLFVEASVCTVAGQHIKECDTGCLICESGPTGIDPDTQGIFGEYGLGVMQCLDTGKINPSVITFNKSILTEPSCQDYAADLAAPTSGQIRIDSVNLVTADPTKIITITATGVPPQTKTHGNVVNIMDVPPGTYTVTISAVGYQSQTLTGTIIVGDTILEGPVTLTQTPFSTVYGVVRKDGNPIGGAIVQVSPTLQDTSSSITGAYEIENVPFGSSVTISVAHPTAGSDSEIVTLDTQNYELDFDLIAGGNIAGVVRYLGTELENIFIAVAGVAPVQSNSVGYYIIENIPAGAWTVTVSDPTGVYETPQFTTTITTGQTTPKNISMYLLVAPSPTGTAILNITLQDNSGTLLPETLVLLYPYGSPTPILGTTDDYGEVIFTDIPTHNYQIVIMKDGYDSYQNVISLDADRAITIILTKKPIWTISGHVENADTGLPLRDSTIRIGDLQVITNLFGDYSINVPQGQRTLSVSKSGFVGKTRVIELVGDLTEDFELLPVGCSELADLSHPVIFDPPTQQDNQIVVSWSNECEADHFNVYVCEGAACDPLGAPIASQKGDSPFIQENIEGDTTYCYVVQAQYSDLMATIRNSTLLCFTTGNQVCLDNEGKFCDVPLKVVMECDNNYMETIDDCDARGEVCISGECQYPSACELCSKPFGIFSIPTKRILATPTASSTTLCDAIDYCYKDFTDTSADEYKECLGADSCYSYRSQGACEQDNCNKGECEWIPSEYEELGQGTCRPVEEEVQDCNRCHQDVNNEVFGACTKSRCDLYGECYFKLFQEIGGPTPKCLNKEEVTCDIYSTEEDCTDGLKLDIDVEWVNFGGSPDYKYLGTNEMLQPSNDSVQLGTCRWNLTKVSTEGYVSACYKDADESNSVDCANLGGWFTRCNEDFEPPVTILQHSDLVNRFDFPFTVIDNNYEQININTYYCIAKQSKFCYPLYSSNYPLPANKVEDVIYQEENPYSLDRKFDDGLYNVYFFSEDGSHNLEPLQFITVELDQTLPSIDVEVLKYVEVIGEELILDLVVNLELIPDKPNENVFCSGELLGSPVELGSASSPDEPLEVWSYSYPGFTHATAGVYTFNYICKDAAGNVLDEDVLINVDPDVMISNPTQDTFDYSIGIPISVQTEEPAVCEYTEDESTWSALIADGDKTTHSTEVSISPVGGVAYKEYSVRCTFDATGIMLYGTPGADDIMVVVDILPPETKTYRDDELYNLAFGAWINSPNDIDLECEDPMIREELPNEFGCTSNSIYYCNTTSTSCIPQQKYSNPFTPHITYPSTICFYSEDDGGNEEFMRCVEIKIDTVDPVIENVKALDPTNLVEIEQSTTRSDIIIEGTIENPVSDVISPIVQMHISINNGEQEETLWSGFDSLTFSKNILLLKNTENRILISAIDEAGNLGTEELVILQDSTGPLISGITIISPTSPVYSAKRNTIQYGFNSDITILEIIDNITASVLTTNDKIDRVDSAWIENIYGLRIPLTRDSVFPQKWFGSLETKDWPFGINKIKIYANDSLGNINSIDYEVDVADTIQPTADIFIENPEGFVPDILGAGTYYAILNVSEPLRNIELFQFRIGTYIGNLTLRARTFKGDRWLSSFEVPPNVAGTGSFDIRMRDANGVLGTTLDNGIFSSDARLPNLPDIPDYVNERDITLSVGQFIPTNYVVKLNGELLSNKGVLTSPLSLRPGENEIYIKAKNDYGSVNEKTYDILYDGYSPKVVEYSPNESSPGPVYVVVKDLEASSGLSSGTMLTIFYENHSIVETITDFTKSGSNYRFETTLAEGEYEAELIGSDNAGNNIGLLKWTFEINTSSTASSGRLEILDTVEPNIVNIENRLFTRPGAEFMITVVVNNEDYELTGTTIIDGTNLQINRFTQNLYEFIWNVPDKEGTYDIVTTLTDINGNKANITSSVTVDGISPTLEANNISLIGVELINGTYLTRNNTIEFTGPIVDTDIRGVYVERNGERYDGTISNPFSVPTTLLGTHMAEIVNGLTLTYEDRAGNKASQSYLVTKDLRPPDLIELTLER